MEDKAVALINNWQVKAQPEYRGFYCGNCLKTIRKAWHIWVLRENLKCEVHLCNNCYKEWQND
jgi:hypothetical protein